MRHKKSISAKTVVDAASLPNPSRDQGFSESHNEIAMLRNVFRKIFKDVVDVSFNRSMSVAWAKFLTDSTPHRNIRTEEEIRTFISAKMYLPNDRIGSRMSQNSSRRSDLKEPAS